ncbi:MAG TPA: NADH-quinone oxidoreductase subunit N [Tepidisphaeraceae bacterium]|nr:NADH-quinone oxidoreductase subunit N [Tepidisphaeraceae bacterium]
MSAELLAAIGVPFIPGSGELRPFLAELWLIAGVVGVLLAPFFTRKANVVCPLVALVAVGMGLVSLLAVGAGPDVSGTYFRGLLVQDPVSFLWKIILLVFVAGVILMWFATTARSLHEGDAAEFFTLLLSATLGMALMGSADNLLMLFMAVETASLPSYVLAGFRKTHRRGAEAALKYVLFGAACSAVMAYGLSLLYGVYGTLQLDALAGAMARAAGGGGEAALLAVGLLGVIVGLGFKLSAVPFHFWCPDVFEGAGIDVTTFLSVASKGAGLVLLVRVMMSVAAAHEFDPGAAVPVGLAVTLGLIGAVTATVGNVAAFAQENVKRLLAYSSIAHAGYMICAASLLVRGPNADAGFDPLAAAAQAVLFYLAVYLFMNLGAFTVAGVVARQTGGETLAAFAGLGRRAPVLAACMALCLFSLVGLPPLAGFGAKFTLLWAMIQNGGWWWALVAVVGVNTVLSLYYYARVVRVMYLEESTLPRLAPAPLGAGLAVGCAAVLVAMFFGWSGMSRVTADHARMELSVERSPPAIRADAR